jgi:hypothetical protein
MISAYLVFGHFYSDGRYPVGFAIGNTISSVDGIDDFRAHRTIFASV